MAIKTQPAKADFITPETQPADFVASQTQPANRSVISTGAPLTADNAMRAARTIGAYLIIARYNWDNEQAVNSIPGEHETARDAARALFPFAAASKSLAQLRGIQAVHTFKTPFFDLLPDDFFSLPSAEQDSIAKAAIEQSGTGNLGIGWIAVIEAGSFQKFVDDMGGRQGPLWRIYDITEIPLNDDQSTNDIYLLMTPRSWN